MNIAVSRGLKPLYNDFADFCSILKPIQILSKQYAIRTLSMEIYNHHHIYTLFHSRVLYAMMCAAKAACPAAKYSNITAVKSVFPYTITGCAPSNMKHCKLCGTASASAEDLIVYIYTKPNA